MSCWKMFPMLEKTHVLILSHFFLCAMSFSCIMYWHHQLLLVYHVAKFGWKTLRRQNNPTCGCLDSTEDNLSGMWKREHTSSTFSNTLQKIQHCMQRSLYQKWIFWGKCPLKDFCLELFSLSTVTFQFSLIYFLFRILWCWVRSCSVGKTSEF